MNFKLAEVKEDYDLLLKIKEDSSRFIKSALFNDPKYSHIKKEVINSVNQD